MESRNEILQKIQEFNDYLDNIDLVKTKESLTRSELKEFSKQLYALKTRNLAYEVSKIAEEKKKEEFPQLLGVCRYPIINEINFLTSEQKIKLDQFIGKHRVGGYVSGLWKVTRNDVQLKQIEDFLLSHGVLEKRFVVMCSRCSEAHVSKMMNEKTKTRVEELLKKEPSWERHEELEKLIFPYCDECHGFMDLESITLEDVVFKTYFKLVKERDKSLDNV